MTLFKFSFRKCHHWWYWLEQEISRSADTSCSFLLMSELISSKSSVFGSDWEQIEFQIRSDLRSKFFAHKHTNENRAGKAPLCDEWIMLLTAMSQSVMSYIRTKPPITLRAQRPGRICFACASTQHRGGGGVSGGLFARWLSHLSVSVSSLQRSSEALSRLSRIPTWSRRTGGAISVSAADLSPNRHHSVLRTIKPSSSTALVLRLFKTCYVKVTPGL